MDEARATSAGSATREGGRRELAPPGRTLGALVALGADVARILDHLTRRRGSITFSQYQLLELLAGTDPSPQEPWELGRGLGRGSAQVTALLDHLERAGLVERHAHGQDRRRRWVHLTDDGRDRVGLLWSQIAELEGRILGGSFTDAERADLDRFGGRVRAALGELAMGDVSFQLVAEPGRSAREPGAS